MAFDSKKGGGSPKPPITQNPAFPAVVALWFAALLGLGSLILPVILLETAVEKSGLAGVLPAASPPLGMTARALVAAIAAVAGAGLGWVIARRLSAMTAPAGKQRLVTPVPSEKRRPISAHDELGDEGLGDSGNGAPRRRSLAMVEDSRPSDFLSLAPVPGHDSHGDEALAKLPEAEPESASEEPLELSELALEEPIAELTTPVETDPDPYGFDAAADTDEEFESLFPSPTERERRADERLASRPEPQTLQPAAEAEPEPLSFAAPSQAHRAPREERAEPIPDFMHEVQDVDFMQDEPQAFSVTSGLQAGLAAPQEDWSQAPLDNLGLVQLVERLGISLEKRREMLAQAAIQQATAQQFAITAEAPDTTVAEAADAPPFAAPPPAMAELFDGDAAEADEAAQAMAAYFGRPAPTPRTFDAEPDAAQTALNERMAALAATSLEPDEDEDAEDELTASFALPLQRPAPASPSPVSFDMDAPTEDEDDGFGSLLELRNPFAAPAQEFVRIEEPEQANDTFEPTVAFPGSQPSLRPAPVPSPMPSSPARAAEANPAPVANGTEARMFDPPAAGSRQGVAAASAGAPADADEALRKALATLQRMSSAG